MQSFNNVNLKEIRTELTALLNTYAAQKGIFLTLGNIGYTENTFKCPISAIIDNQAPSEEAKGLPTPGTKFSGPGSTQVFTVTGLKLNRPKYPICASAGGKNYKFTIEQFEKCSIVK